MQLNSFPEYDELAGVSFHGQILTMLPHGVGHLWGEWEKIAAETILQIKPSNSSFLSSRMLSKHPLDSPVKIVKRLADPCGRPEFDHLISEF